MLEEKDRPMIKGLIQILDTGTFPLKAKEVPPFHMVYRWVQDLESKIQVNTKASQVKIEELPEEKPNKKARKKK